MPHDLSTRMVKVAGRCSRPIRGVPGQSHGPASATLGISIGVQFPSDWRAGHPDRGSGGCLGPDEEFLGVVVHSGLVLGRSKDVVVAVRRITALPGGLALD